MNNYILLAEKNDKNTTTIDRLVHEGFRVDRVKDFRSAIERMGEKPYGMVLTSSHLDAEENRAGWKNRQLGLALALYAMGQDVPLIGHYADGGMYSTELNRATTTAFGRTTTRKPVPSLQTTHSSPDILPTVQSGNSLLALADCDDFPVLPKPGEPVLEYLRRYSFDLNRIEDANDTRATIKDYHAFAHALLSLKGK
ncbi:MAG: hypothetical protein ACMXYF_01250 [Candidatus Woesearchaeota archaeon]